MLMLPSLSLLNMWEQDASEQERSSRSFGISGDDAWSDRCQRLIKLLDLVNVDCSLYFQGKRI